VRRRDFITLLGGAAAWPVVGRAQQGERMRRIGVLMHLAADDPEAQARIAAFLQGLQAAGWEVGRNIRVDTRWSTGDLPQLRKDATELVALNPDVILAGIGATAPVLAQTTQTVPVVLAQALDPVGAGYVDSMARPGGNVTGFIQFEYSLSGKWLELLKEIAPRVGRVGVLREPGPAAIGQWAIVQAVAQSMGVEAKPVGLPNATAIERDITEFSRGQNGGLVVLVSAASFVHRDLIIALAAQHRLPAAYSHRSFVASGGLISYGADLSGNYRRAAGYVDRILKGEKPANLPVQAPTKYELVINLKTAKALGLEVPPTLLARADEVIE